MAAEQLLDLAGDERELEEVSGCLQHLAVLQKAVHTYLDNKRRVFPRFVLLGLLIIFFLSLVFFVSFLTLSRNLMRFVSKRSHLQHSF